MDVDVCQYVAPSGESEGWESVVRAACSERCARLSWESGYTCDDEKWQDVDVLGIPCNFAMCPGPTAAFDFDVIETQLGTTAAEQAADLPCDLWNDCIDLLSQPARLGMSTEPDQYTPLTADVDMETSTLGGSEIYLLGAGQSTGSSAPLVGALNYSATNCGADACPFYLAHIELETVSSFSVTLDYASTTLTKSIDGLSVRLSRPALGLWLPSSGDIIFPPNSLTVRTSATISGTPEPFGENGAHDDDHTIRGYVFGALDPLTGEVTLSAWGSDFLGDFTIDGLFVEI